MNIIFLDVDGVLNGNNVVFNTIIHIWKLLHLPTRILAKQLNLYSIHERKVKILSKICKRTNSKVVLISTCRFDVWNNNRKIPSVDKLLTLFDKYDIDLIGVTDRMYLYNHYSERTMEIKRWLRDNPGVKRFIIIDDESVEGLEEYQIRTSNYNVNKSNKFLWLGLRNKHIKESITLLQSQDEYSVNKAMI